MNQKEEQSLKILSLESMLAMVKNLVIFSEEYERKQEENRRKITMLDNTTAPADKDNDDNSSNGDEEIKEIDFDKADA